MPFGVDKDMGGDNKSNDAWMEKCVTRVQQSGKDKSSSIAICKAQLKKKKMSKAETMDEFEGIDPEIIQRFAQRKQEQIRHLMASGKTYAQAVMEFNNQLELADYNF